MVLEHPLLSHNSKPYSWHQERNFLIKNTGFCGAPKILASHSTCKATKVMSAQSQSSHRAALLHPGNNSLIFPEIAFSISTVQPRKGLAGFQVRVLKKIFSTYQTVGFFSLLPFFFSFFFSFPQIYPPAQHFFFCLWQGVLIMVQHDLPIINTIKKGRLAGHISSPHSYLTSCFFKFPDEL